MPADASGTFFVLSGDANHDRSVDLTDFTILAANFNGSDKRFSEGDFNYDTSVDLTDFTILASKFNQTLGPAASAALAAPPAPAAANPSPQVVHDRLVWQIGEAQPQELL